MSRFLRLLAVLTLAMSLAVVLGKYEQNRQHQVLVNDLGALNGELYDATELSKLSDSRSLVNKILSHFRPTSRGVSLPIHGNGEASYTESVLATLRDVDSLAEITIRRSLHHELYPSADCLKIEAIVKEFPRARLVFAPH